MVTDNGLVQQYKPTRKDRESDPLTTPCKCISKSGKVLLFYKYFLIESPILLVNKLTSFCTNLKYLTGKIRISKEGINATIAGNNDILVEFVVFLENEVKLACSQDLKVDSFSWTKELLSFYKPTPGCMHVFDSLKIKECVEVCPFNNAFPYDLELFATQKNSIIKKLEPETFHLIVKKINSNKSIESQNKILIDVRNYYESNIGSFKNSLKLPIRNFKSLGDYLIKNKEYLKNKHVITFCTGGVRCEKTTLFIEQVINPLLPETEKIKSINMLEGGIHAYFDWIKKQKYKSSNMLEITSLFVGRNYIFDARQSIAIDGSSIHYDSGLSSAKEYQFTENEPISYCQVCNKKQSYYIKCEGKQCHLLLIRCPVTCSDNQNSFCCLECRLWTQSSKQNEHRRFICECERNRRELCLKPMIQLTTKTN